MTVASSPPPSAYLMRSAPRALVLGSFIVVALPLAAYLLMRSNGAPAISSTAPIAQAYIVLFGVTHFFLTFTVFLSAANRQHFMSSRRNMIAFVVAPLVPLVGIAAWYGLGLSDRFVAAGIALFTATRALDFYHLSRQSFGVLQLFKGRTGRLVPAWTRTAENFYFLALALLMFLTFANDLRFDTHSFVTWAAVAAASGLLVAVLTGYAIALRAGADKKQTAIALAYLAVQTGSCLLAVYRTGLYVASLAVHYVEYHVIMAPRVFSAPLHEDDRMLARLRRAPLVLYAGLVGVSVIWWFLFRMQTNVTSGPASTRALVHVFDGIFVFHYVIEMSIWKFSDPYFRKSLGPIYMG